MEAQSITLQQCFAWCIAIHLPLDTVLIYQIVTPYPFRCRLLVIVWRLWVSTLKGSVLLSIPFWFWRIYRFCRLLIGMDMLQRGVNKPCIHKIILANPFRQGMKLKSNVTHGLLTPLYSISRPIDNLQNLQILQSQKRYRQTLLEKAIISSQYLYVSALWWNCLAYKTICDWASENNQVDTK